MKKIYLCLSGLLVSSLAMGQINNALPATKKYAGKTIKKAKNPVTNPEEKLTIWEDDFSAAADWTESNTSSTPSGTWTWENDPAIVPAYGPADMTTASNGFYFINSDAEGETATQDAYVQSVDTVDLSVYPNVVLEFEHHYRTYLDTREIQVSSDLGATWTTYTITDGAEANTNFSGKTEINASAAVGGQAQVLVRFHYIGNWGWHWAVDDLKIIEQPDNDIQLLSSYFVGADNEGVEYGRTPEDQVNASHLIGGAIFNFGATDQTSVEMVADYGSFTSNFAPGTVASGDTVYPENTETPTLTPAVYNGLFTVTSAEEPDDTDGNFGNNTYNRNFEITANADDALYSVDGIGIHETADEELGSLGTPSWAAESADGFFIGNYMKIHQAADFKGIQIGITPSTSVDGMVRAHIIDTADWFADGTTPIVSSSEYYITQTDIDNGYANIEFDATASLNPDAYIVAAELYSGGNTNDIRIFDDLTVVQPTYASMINMSGGDGITYTNGEALAVRLMKGTVGGIDENSLEGINIYPNPSEGIINVTNDKGYENTITVLDMTGKVLFTETTTSTATTINLETATGVYLVEVANETGKTVERVVIK